jgi:long-chain acyl-CoA synthetase
MASTTTRRRAADARTIADLLPCAAEEYGTRAAIAHRDGDSWVERSYEEIAASVRELALGLLALGVERGDRVALVAETRPEFVLFDFAIAAAGGVVTTLYPSSTAEELERVLRHLDATTVVCESADHAAKLEHVRGRLPQLRDVVTIDAAGRPGTLSVDDLRARGADRSAADLERRIAEVEPDDLYTIIQTSGTTGPTKSCMITHRNYRASVETGKRVGIMEEDEVTYLLLPLSHAYARFLPLMSMHLGGKLAFFGGDYTEVLTELAEVRPTVLPGFPRLFEKLYVAITSQLDPEQLRRSVEVGLEVRRLRREGAEVPAELAEEFERYDAELFANVRGLFGGRLRQAVSGASPIAREILEFFHASGVPVLEAWGQTECSTLATCSTLEQHKIGSVGRFAPGVEGKVSEQSEVLLRGENIFAGYYGDERRTRETIVDGWLRTGDVGEIDEDGYVWIEGRLRHVQTLTGGERIIPTRLEDELKQSRWISQAVIYGDGRPHLVALLTLDEEQFALAHDGDQGGSRDPRARQLVEEVVEAYNARHERPGQIPRYALLDHDLTLEAGEITPSMKVKRDVVEERYRTVVDSLYDPS